MLKSGITRWECMIQEFKELREAICDDYRSSMKDLANFLGGIGHRMAEQNNVGVSSLCLVFSATLVALLC